MIETTMTRARLVDAIHEEIGLSRNDSSQFVEDLLQKLGATLVENEEVKLSSFGSFQVRHKAKRMGRNPKTGEEVPILARRVLSFRASHVLKDKVNRALDGANARGKA